MTHQYSVFVWTQVYQILWENIWKTNLRVIHPSMLYCFVVIFQSIIRNGNYINSLHCQFINITTTKWTKLCVLDNATNGIEFTLQILLLLMFTQSKYIRVDPLTTLQSIISIETKHFCSTNLTIEAFRLHTFHHCGICSMSRESNTELLNV